MALHDFFYSMQKKETVTKYIVPARIMASEGAENTECLLKDSVLQASVYNHSYCLLRQGGSILVDFGSELQGGIAWTVGTLESDRIGASEYGKYGRLRIVFGESVSEAMSCIGDSQKAQNDHAVRDAIVDATFMSTSYYGNTGFRFVRIQALDCDIELISLKAALEYRDIPYLGSFSSNDARLNAVFDTAAYTVHLCMQDYIWDGIKRDRLVWPGDMHPEVSTILRVFGRDPSVEKSLDFTRDAFPLEEDGSGEWMVFPSYSSWWLILHRDWYMYTGDLGYLLAQKTYVMRLCRKILGCICPDGSLQFDGELFVEWSSNKTPYMEAGFRGCLVLGLEAASQITAWYGEMQMSAELKQAAVWVKKTCESFDGNKQVCAMVGLAGLCSGEEAVGIIQKDLLQGLSTFYGYYVLRLLGQQGRMKEAMKILRDYWGAMLDLGATTFWEDFDIQWTEDAGRIDEFPVAGKRDVHAEYGKFCYRGLRHSLCHGWASGPSAFLSEYVLGIQIEEPGCRVLRIVPQLGDLEHVEGTFPTPSGVVTVRHEKHDGKVYTRVNAPEGIRIILDENIIVQ